MNVSAVLDAYLSEHVEHKVVDPRRQRDGIKHLKRHLGDIDIAAVGIPESRKYLAARKKEGVIESTIRRELNILTAAANHGRRWRRLKHEDLPQIELPELPKYDEVKWFTKEQVATMFRARPSGRFACFLRICYFTAARRRSIEGLTKKQVDLASGVIHLAKPGEKITKKRRPTVPLYPEIRPALEWLIANSGTNYVFGSARDFYKPFSLLMEELGYEGHPHMLRHSRATHMLQDGEDLFKVARLLGDSVATVERVYAHASIEYLHTSSSAEGAEIQAGGRRWRDEWFRPIAAE